MGARKTYAEMTAEQLHERVVSAKRRMDRYSAMGNDALFAIAKAELDAVTAELNARLTKGNK